MIEHRGRPTCLSVFVLSLARSLAHPDERPRTEGASCTAAGRDRYRLTIAGAVFALSLLGGGQSSVADVCQGSFADVFATAAPSVPRIVSLSIDPFRQADRVQFRVGSGVVFDDNSDIVTNAHVVIGSAKVAISLGNDGRMWRATVLGTDPVSDLAVVRPEEGAPHAPKMPLGQSSKVRVGEDVLAVGYPLGLEITATKGIVSGASRIVPLAALSWMTPLIQLDAALNPGNSGGPILNACGEVIGIGTLGSTKAQNINFAIPMDEVTEIATQIVEHGRMIRAWHGINGQMIPSELTDLLHVPEGFMVETIEPGSPAQQIGLRGGNFPIRLGMNQYLIGGDIILSVNGTRLDNIGTVANIARGLKVGDTIAIEYWRDGRTERASVTLPERPVLPGDIQELLSY